MKATIDIPDELYRRVKARSALEGRPLRSVAVELFQGWIDGDASPRVDAPEEEAGAPWLAITTKYVRPGMRHDLESIRAAVSAGWGVEGAAKLKSSES